MCFLFIWLHLEATIATITMCSKPWSLLWQGGEPSYLLLAKELPHHHVPGAAATDAHVLLLTERLHGSLLLHFLLSLLVVLPFLFHLRAKRSQGHWGRRQHRVHQTYLRQAGPNWSHPWKTRSRKNRTVKRAVALQPQGDALWPLLHTRTDWCTGLTSLYSPAEKMGAAVKKE